MKVRIEYEVGVLGSDSVRWTPSEAPEAIDVAPAVLRKWQREYERMQIALGRWRQVTDEVMECLYQTEEARASDREPARGPFRVKEPLFAADPQPHMS